LFKEKTFAIHAPAVELVGTILLPDQMVLVEVTGISNVKFSLEILLFWNLILTLWIPATLFPPSVAVIYDPGVIIPPVVAVGEILKLVKLGL